MSRARILVTTILLICLFPLLSGSAAARPVASGLAAPAAPVTTAFTYQGHLNDDGSPANGSYDLRFILYNALAGGAQAGPIVNRGDVAVSDGAFTVSLDFGAVFDGVALWLEIAVRPGASGGAYTILSPRQPLTATPYALGLIPGATLKNGAGSGLIVEDATVNGLWVKSADSDGLGISSAGSDGVHVGTTGESGLRVDNAGANGIWVKSAGADGLGISSAGDDGVHIQQAESNGVRVALAKEHGVYVGSAGWDGIHVRTAISSGLHIDHANSDGIFICSTGNETGCTPSLSNNGIEIGNADRYGLYVDSAGWSALGVGSTGGNGLYVVSAGATGLYVGSAGHNGLSVDSAGNHGLRVGSADVYGVNVYGDRLAGYFGNDIQVDGSCTGCTLATFAVNASDQPLQPGDVVTVQGVQASGVDGVPVLMAVVPAGAGQSIVGVVDGRAEIHIDDEPRPDAIGKQLIPRDGPAQPGDYVTVITYGLAPVNVGDSLSARSITAGTKLALDTGGSARSLKTAVVEGIQITESAPTVGLALSSPDPQGQVWVMVSPQ